MADAMARIRMAARDLRSFRAGVHALGDFDPLGERGRRTHRRRRDDQRDHRVDFWIPLKPTTLEWGTGVVEFSPTHSNRRNEWGTQQIIPVCDGRTEGCDSRNPLIRTPRMSGAPGVPSHLILPEKPSTRFSQMFGRGWPRSRAFRDLGAIIDCG